MTAQHDIKKYIGSTKDLDAFVGFYQRSVSRFEIGFFVVTKDKYNIGVIDNFKNIDRYKDLPQFRKDYLVDDIFYRKSVIKDLGYPNLEYAEEVCLRRLKGYQDLIDRKIWELP